MGETTGNKNIDTRVADAGLLRNTSQNSVVGSIQG